MDIKNGIYSVGKKFEAYVNGELLGSSYNQRSVEIMIEKKMGTFVDRRGRKKSNVSVSGGTDQSPVKSPSKVHKEVSTEVPDDVQKFDINERFEFLVKAVSMVASGVQPSVVVAGSGGLGKTYTVKKTLLDYGLKDITGIVPEEGEVIDKEDSFLFIKGFSTAKNLYRTLYNNNGCVIVLDDVDSVLKDANAVNLLKACLDSYDKRVVTWGAEMKSSDDDLPRTFEFTGCIIFITNLDVEKIDQAVRSRSLIIDVSMTLEETIERMTEIVKAKSFCPNFNMEVKLEALEFIDLMKYKARELSLRTLITICKIRNEFPNEWRDMAEYVLGPGK